MPDVTNQNISIHRFPVCLIELFGRQHFLNDVHKFTNMLMKTAHHNEISLMACGSLYSSGFITLPVCRFPESWPLASHQSLAWKTPTVLIMTMRMSALWGPLYNHCYHYVINLSLTGRCKVYSHGCSQVVALYNVYPVHTLIKIM